MAGRGPAPKSDPVRRNPRASGVVLPAEGRQGDPPPWPLPADAVLTARLNVLRAEQADIEQQLDKKLTVKEANKLRHRLGQNVEKVAIAEAVLFGGIRAELELWVELWHTPHAVVWERMLWTREVAQYARWKAKAELGDLEASKEARMLADRLGLTPKAMQDLRWQIVADEVGERRQASAGSRGRVRAV